MLGELDQVPVEGGIVAQPMRKPLLALKASCRRCLASVQSDPAKVYNLFCRINEPDRDPRHPLEEVQKWPKNGRTFGSAQAPSNVTN